MKFLSTLVAVLFITTAPAFAQSAKDSVKYDHQDLFGPITWPTGSAG